MGAGQNLHERGKPQMKRRGKKLNVMDWVLVGLLDTLAGVVAGGLMAVWQLPSAYRWRGYWAIGGAADTCVPNVHDFRRKEAW